MMTIKMMNGNIADMSADAIVLPTNMSLKEGNGCSKAIFEKAGRTNLQRECDDYINKYGMVRVGNVVKTSAYNLKAEMILHTVVPKWINGESEEYLNLRMAYTNVLKEADIQGCKSIAIPLLASGNNGFDLERAFQIAIETIKGYEVENNLQTVLMVLYGNRIVSIAVNQDYQVFYVGNEDRESKENHDYFITKQEARALLMRAGMRIKEFDHKHPYFRIAIGKCFDNMLIEKFELDHEEVRA